MHTDAHDPPVTRITVLHDPACPLCRRLTAWLHDQDQLVPLDFVAVASAEARERYPGLDHDASLGEITVVADTGEVWRGPQAFVTCLWALAEHRPLAQRLGTPAGLPLARAAAFAAGRYRAATAAGRAAPGAEGASGTARPEDGGWAAVAGSTTDGGRAAVGAPRAGARARVPADGPPRCVDGACTGSG
ncbi:thiol-disulfide oxidoreductase DCC family protein [Kitasatospora sp. NPDC057015]|uniref:thiol-disulfide oxidoreductase DCC family protein n=1 Tax=Kitasatospora sp. NPDC057015 TaxID=3346001 RepID=UPI00363CFE0A